MENIKWLGILKMKKKLNTVLGLNIEYYKKDENYKYLVYMISI